MPTLTTLPPEVLPEICLHVPLRDLHHSLCHVNKLFYITVPSFIIRELTRRLAKHPKLSTYEQELCIENHVLKLTLTQRILPHEVFPWHIRMSKLTTFERLFAILSRVVAHIERASERRAGMNSSSDKVLVKGRQWAWVNL